MSGKDVAAFVREKIGLLDEENPWSRGMRAKMRRGIGKAPGELPEIWDLTLNGLKGDMRGKDGKASSAELAIHTALTLYALHRQGALQSVSGGSDTFGGAAARLIRKDALRLDSVKRRFNAAATSVDFTELANHARGIVQLLKAEGIILDYPSFASDLYYYQFPKTADNIRLKWGNDFYFVLGYKEPDKNGKDGAK